MNTTKYTTITKYEKDRSDNIYFNIEMRSEDKTSKDNPARYDVQRTIPVISDSSDYYATIIRFNIPNFLVPLHVMPIQDNQGNPNLSNYSVTLEFDGDIQQAPLIYVTRSSQQTPLPPNANQNGKQTDSPYYYIFDYQHMVDMINTSFLTAYANLSSPPPGSAAPIMTFDPVTNLFSIVSQEEFYNVDIATPIKVYLNYPLWTLFGAFTDQQLIVETLTADGRDVQILIRDNFYKNLNVPNYNPPFSGDYLVLTQQYGSIFNWNPFKRIVLVSNSLPINGENIQGNGSTTLKVLTDFMPFVAKDVRTVWQYNPHQYRLIDMISHEKIDTIDLQMYWVDQFDNFHIILIPWGQECTIKLAFLNKKLFKNYVTRKTVSDIKNRYIG